MSKKKTTEEFINEAKQVHGDKYEYSKVEYINNRGNVCIICPIHGEFWQTPNNHLKRKGCPKCACEKRWDTRGRFTLEEVKKQFKLIHGDKYDYSAFTEYKNNITKIPIICPKHGEFWQTPNNHLRGKGCAACTNNKKHTKNSYIKKAKEIHGNKYDYSKVKYVNAHTKVCIICPTHGKFWQEADSHLQGCECPKCSCSLLENDIRQFLLNENIIFFEQKTFEWLKNKQNLYLDFYLPEYNVAIECQGVQHFIPIKHFGGEKKNELTKKLDEVKKELCEKHNINLFYYSNLGIEYPYKVYEDFYEMLHEIKKK